MLRTAERVTETRNERTVDPFKHSGACQHAGISHDAHLSLDVVVEATCGCSWDSRFN